MQEVSLGNYNLRVAGKPLIQGLQTEEQFLDQLLENIYVQSIYFHLVCYNLI